MVHRSEEDVSYVDVHDRAGLVAPYTGHDNVKAEAIPEIDYTLVRPDGRTVTVAEAAKAGAPFDWVIASHVIEHVPDVIGWLQDIGELVADEGDLVLAVPDRRYCFDAHRPSTTVGQMIEAYDLGATVPSVRAVYDYFTTVVDVDASALWRGESPSYDRRIHGIAEARAKADEARAGRYVDCHVWLFTPDSFLEQMHELRITGLSPWVVEELVPTRRNDSEFKVRMRRLPRLDDPTGPLDSEVLSTAVRPGWLNDELVADLRARLAGSGSRSHGSAARSSGLNVTASVGAPIWRACDAADNGASAGPSSVRSGPYVDESPRGTDLDPDPRTSGAEGVGRTPRTG